MVGLEIATGLTDYVDTISSIAHQVHSDTDLIQLGVPPEHASPILRLIISQKRVVSLFNFVYYIQKYIFFYSK